MKKLARQLRQARWMPPVAILVTILILGVTILLASLALRRSIREQIIRRDAEVLDAVAMLEQLGADSPADLRRRLEDAGGQLELTLRLSRLREGVMAARLFNAHGEFVNGVPANVRAGRLNAGEIHGLQTLQPASRFEAKAQLADYFLVPPATSSPTNRTPMLSILIPIHAPDVGQMLAVAELVLDGTGIDRELRKLDQHLFWQAALGFLLSGGAAGFALAWAFFRLQTMNRRLQNQAARLRRANQELALSNKTSALGAVTAHVIHGLTSPLNGLQNFVDAHAEGGEEWQAAMVNTRRMQTLVGEVMRVLGEQTQGIEYELSFEELAQVLERRVQPAAQTAGVQYEQCITARGELSSRTANLLLLILENLVQNAFQATPAGKRVTLSMAQASTGLRCEVTDEGCGLPPALLDRLFVPCRSTKASGNGLGLALSQHLARQLGAELRLVRSNKYGTTFALQCSSSRLERQPVEEPLLTNA